MIKRFRVSFCIGFLLIATAVLVWAAPIRPVGPVDVIGLIQEITWIPEQKVWSRTGISGSAGRDRMWPAHFLITLTDYAGVTAETALVMTRYLDQEALKNNLPQRRPPFILLKIDHSQKNYLGKGMKIKVTGYTVRGDEGGTWTSFKTVEILNRQSLVK